MVLELLKKNYRVIILDNLSTGHKKLINKHAKFYHGDIRDKYLVNKILVQNKINAVIDFAACSIVSESMIKPIKYFQNNISATINFLELLCKHDINKIIFSSSAAVYGEPNNIPVTEQELVKPINPYGESKATIEKILYWLSKTYKIKYIILRYFNVAGADASATIGEDHNPETHLIPIVLKSILQKKIINLYGNNYPTCDGTCIRDYIHVTDLVRAHILALEYLSQEKSHNKIYNLGNQTGFSVLEIIKTAELITQQKINYKISQRREGDPAILIASHNKIKQELNWQPEFINLKQIISSAWNWHSTQN